YDGGATWNVEAAGILNSGSYTWVVPAVASSNVRLAVVKIAFVEASGVVTDAEIGETGTFRITAPAGIGNSAYTFALRGVWPTPARGAFSVSFSLPGPQRATLALYDVAGRHVLSREVGSMGA